MPSELSNRTTSGDSGGAPCFTRQGEGDGGREGAGVLTCARLEVVVLASSLAHSVRSVGTESVLRLQPLFCLSQRMEAGWLWQADRGQQKEEEGRGGDLRPPGDRAPIRRWSGVRRWLAAAAALLPDNEKGGSRKGERTE